MLRVISSAAVSSIAVIACGGTSAVTFPSTGSSATASADAAIVVVGSDADAPALDASVSADDAGAAVPDATTTFAAPDAASDAGNVGPSTVLDAGDAGDLLSGLAGITAHCTVASNGTYATDRSSTAAVNICKLNGAFFWTADLAIDCDGQKTTQCNATTDTSFAAQTTLTQSNGQPLIASELPYVVIPLPSTRFDYTKESILPGALAIVVYNGQIVYGIFGDEGPTSVIGEASYAMAAAFGMNTNPNSGGTSGSVTYIVLTGKGAVVSPSENHAAAVTLAGALVPALIASN